MKIELLNIGDELLIGQVVNSNAAMMAEMLNKSGFVVDRMTCIGDAFEEIVMMFGEALSRSDVVLVTGGLGPTSDDRTRDALCEFFGCRMRTDPEVLRNIERIFANRSFPMTPANLKQAEVPDGCTVLMNLLGTSPGMWFKEKGKILAAMPGVPFELEQLMRDEIIPRLLAEFSPQGIFHKTVLTTGVGESFLAEKIASWEAQLPPEISLAYLPQPGIVKLRLSAKGNDLEQVQQTVTQEVRKLEILIPDLIFGYDQDTLESVVGTLLLQLNASVSTAESCTGGAIASLITSIPGSSRYFKGAVVSYDNQVKINSLKVDQATIEADGAVSEAVVIQMAQNVRALLGTDYSIAVSGVAGPDGGTPQKPVGTTWICIAKEGCTRARKFTFGDHRGRNIRRASWAALKMLMDLLKEDLRGNKGDL